MDTVGIRKYAGAGNTLGPLFTFTPNAPHSLVHLQCVCECVCIVPSARSKAIMVTKNNWCARARAREANSTSKLDPVLMTRPHHCALLTKSSIFINKQTEKKANEIRFTWNRTNFGSSTSRSFVRSFLFLFFSRCCFLCFLKWNTNDKNKTSDGKRELCIHFWLIK